MDLGFRLKDHKARKQRVEDGLEENMNFALDIFNS